MEADNRSEESEEVVSEEIQAGIAEKVREESKNSAKLVSIDSLTALGPELSLDDIRTNLLVMADSDDYTDIKSVVAPSGVAYLYSDTYITKEYADIQSRVEADDRCSTIAMTVRDESRIYPRLTSIEFFGEPIFNIEPDEVEVCVTRTMEREEFKDVRLIVASTGARYLYSDLYINEDYARTLVEWEEVGQFDNP